MVSKLSIAPCDVVGIGIGRQIAETEGQKSTNASFLTQMTTFLNKFTFSTIVTKESALQLQYNM